MASILSMVFGGAVDMSKTKTETNILNESITNVLLEISSTCKAEVNNTQSVTSKRSFSNINNTTIDARYIQGIKSKLNFSCIQNTNIENTLKDKISREIDNVIEKKTTGFGGKSVIDASEQEIITNLKTTITKNIDIKSLTECLVAIKNSQSIVDEVDFTNISGSNIDATITQKLVEEAVFKCTQSNKAITDASFELNEIIKSKTTSTSEGMDFGYIFMIIIALIIVGFFVMKMKGNMMGQRGQQNPYMYY